MSSKIIIRTNILSSFGFYDSQSSVLDFQLSNFHEDNLPLLVLFCSNCGVLHIFLLEKEARYFKHFQMCIDNVFHAIMDRAFPWIRLRHHSREILFHLYLYSHFGRTLPTQCLNSQRPLTSSPFPSFFFNFSSHLFLPSLGPSKLLIQSRDIPLIIVLFFFFFVLLVIFVPVTLRILHHLLDQHRGLLPCELVPAGCFICQPDAFLGVCFDESLVEMLEVE